MTPGNRPRWEFGRHLASLFGWRSAAEDAREEMALHRELRARELEAQGVPTADAWARAGQEVGADAAVLPVVARLAASGDRRSRVRQWLGELRQDLRHTWRSSLRSPGYTALVVLTIAVGIGANAAMFAVVDVAVIRPLPFDQDHTLVRVREVRVAPDGTRVNVDASRRSADAVADRPDVFRSSVALSGSGRTLDRPGGALRVAGMRVGPGFTQVVGIAPMLGRTFTRDEEEAGEAGGAVLISHRLFQAAFGGDSAIIGEPIRLDGQSFTVVGVLPVNFRIPYETDAWFPSQFGENERGIFILARLAPGVSLSQVRAALEPTAQELNRRYPEVMRGLSLTAVDAREYFAANEEQPALMLMAAVSLLLLIGCANVALLLTTKFAARQVEVAVRASLGCSRARQIRQFVTEGVALFLVGGAIGVGLAALSTDALVVLLPHVLASEVGLTGLTVDWRLLTFAAALSVTTGIGFGLIAAMRTSGVDLNAIVKSGGRSVAGTTTRGTLGALVVAELALALVLLSTASVMVDTFRRLNSRDLGFDPAGVLTMQVDLNAPRYASEDARRMTVRTLLGRIARLPGVESTGATTVNPLCCGDWGMRVTPFGYPAVSAELTPIVQHFIVTPGYFDTLRRGVVEGRDFTELDDAGTEPIVIIDEAAARRFWPGESAIGKRIKRGTLDEPWPWLTVVGVVASAFEEGEYAESWYLPQAQHATGPSADVAHLLVRATGGTRIPADDIRAVISGIDPSLAVYGVDTLDGLRAANLEQDRLAAWVSAAFGIGGLLLAGLGLYGVLSFIVAGDRVEIAVRVALGASSLDVWRLIVGRGLRLAALGLAIGAAASALVFALLPRLVEVAQPDPWMIVGSGAGLLAVAMLAMVAPTLRAQRLDPLDAMRS